MDTRSWRSSAVVATSALVLFLVLLATATNAIPWGHGADQEVHAWLLAHRSGPGVAVATAVAATGTSVVTILAVGLAGLLVTAGKLWTRVISAASLVAVVAAGVLCRTLVSALVARARPPRQDWADPATGFSFPSGHSTDSFLAAAVIAWLVARRLRAGTAGRTAIWLVASLYVLAVGASRIYLGVHWPTDVLGGWTFATVWLATALALERLASTRLPAHVGR